MSDQYEVQEFTLIDGWINNWSGDEGPLTFDSPEEAQAELDSFFEEISEAVSLGHMDEEYDPNNFRIVKISS